jgi:hypothetical protein
VDQMFPDHLTAFERMVDVRREKRRSELQLGGARR